MALEYRIYQLVLDQSAPEGNTGMMGFQNEGLIWAGQVGTFPTSQYTSRIMTLFEVAQLYAGYLQEKTQNYIEKYMPQWRLNRWRRYYDLRQKVLAGLTLNMVEQSEYDCFPDPTEQHADCDGYVGPVLKWCADVIVEHNKVYFGMFGASTIENILTMKDSISYPPFLM